MRHAKQGRGQGRPREHVTAAGGCLPMATKTSPVNQNFDRRMDGWKGGWMGGWMRQAAGQGPCWGDPDALLFRPLQEATVWARPLHSHSPPGQMAGRFDVIVSQWQ